MITCELLFTQVDNVVYCDNTIRQYHKLQAKGFSFKMNIKFIIEEIIAGKLYYTALVLAS